MKNDIEKINNAEQNENARVEYTVANDTYMHSDNFAWQVGSVLLAGVFIFWGFIISNPPKLTILLISNLLVCLLMSIWILYTEHNRQIYRYQLHRIWQLEEQLGMCLHKRFQKNIYKLDKPRGHHLSYAVYIIVSTGGLLPGIIQTKLDEWKLSEILLFFLTLIIVFCICYRIYIMDHRVKQQIKKIDGDDL
jgi:hypothetical protein